ncbi:hypothetical protein Fmac_022015 [Flemingia macrophylla]|uniref:FHA domain-containing protein n=1 Tax=Flemingia macrophylla TaxID=520843 RepID=A0ABD1LYH6_9FABA
MSRSWREPWKLWQLLCSRTVSDPTSGWTSKKGLPTEGSDRRRVLTNKEGTQQHRHLFFVFVFVSGQPCSGDLRPPVHKRLRSPSESLRHHALQGPPKRIGRAIEGNPVDIDLGKGGQGNAISRRQAIIKMDKDGSFYIKTLGKSSILVNSKEVHTGQSQKLHSNYLVENIFVSVKGIKLSEADVILLVTMLYTNMEMADGGHSMALLKPVGGIGCGELDKSPCAVILIHEDCSNFGQKTSRPVTSLHYKLRIFY